MAHGGSLRRRTGETAGVRDAAGDDDESERRRSTNFCLDLFIRLKEAIVKSLRFLWKVLTQFFRNDETNIEGVLEHDERNIEGVLEQDDLIRVRKPPKKRPTRAEKKKKEVIATLMKALDKSDYAYEEIKEALEKSNYQFIGPFYSLRSELRQRLYQQFKDTGLTKEAIYHALKVNRMSSEATIGYLNKELRKIVRSNLKNAEISDERIDEALKESKMNALKASAILVKELVADLQWSVGEEKEEICKRLAESIVEKSENRVEEIQKKYEEKIYTVLDEAAMNVRKASSALTGFGKQKSTIKKKREVQVTVKTQIHNSRYSRTRLPSVSKYMEILENGSQEREKPNTPSEDRPDKNEFTFKSLDTSIELVYEDIEASMIESYVRLEEVTHDNLMPIMKICCNEENQIKIGYQKAPRLTDFPENSIFINNGRLETLPFRYLISCVIEGASCLHSWDMYHGNITPSSVFVLKTPKGVHYLLGCYKYSHETGLEELKQMMMKDIGMIASFIRSMIEDHGRIGENHYELEHLCEVLEKPLLDKKLFSLMQIKCLIFGHPGMLSVVELADYIIGAYEFLARKGLLKLLKDGNILSDRGWFEGFGEPYRQYLTEKRAVLSPKSGSDYIRTVYCCLNHRKEDIFNYEKIEKNGDPTGLLQHTPGRSPVEIVTFFRNRQPKMVVELYKVAYEQGFNYIPKPFHEFHDGDILVQ